MKEGGKEGGRKEKKIPTDVTSTTLIFVCEATGAFLSVGSRNLNSLLRLFSVLTIPVVWNKSDLDINFFISNDPDLPPAPVTTTAVRLSHISNASRHNTMTKMFDNMIISPIFM